MLSLLYFVLSVAIITLLWQVSFILALLFFLLAAISLPAIMLHRREAAAAVECGPDAESHGKGLIRLAGMVGLDTTGVALAVLLLLLGALVAHLIAYGH